MPGYQQSPSLLILTVDAGGRENCWLVDDWKEAGSGERDLFRSGEYIITLSFDDYANGWIEQKWDGVHEVSGEELDLEFDEDGDAVLSLVLPTIH